MMRIRFNNLQREIWAYDKEYNPITTILEGSVRTGKTILLIYLWLRFINSFRGKKKNFIMTGYTMPALKKNVLDEMVDMFGIEIKMSKENRFKLWGHTIHCFGTDKENSYKSMRGFTAQGWLGNEITLTHPNSYAEAMNRCSEDGFRHFLDTNPDHPKHTIKINLVDKSDCRTKTGRVRIKSWHFTLPDNSVSNNGFISDEYIENLKANTPTGMLYDRNILALWNAAEGQIYKDWDKKRMVVSDTNLPAFKEYIMGVDWGFEHYGSIVIIGVTPDNKYYLVDGKRERLKDVDVYWLPLKKEYCRKYNIPMGKIYCDSARPEYVRKFSGLNANKAVLSGIAMVATIIKQGRFFVTESMLNDFEEEVYMYKWSDRGKEEPIKKYDDLLDAIRYAIYSCVSKGTVKFGRVV